MKLNGQVTDSSENFSLLILFILDEHIYLWLSMN